MAGGRGRRALPRPERTSHGAHRHRLPQLHGKHGRAGPGDRRGGRVGRRADPAPARARAGRGGRGGPRPGVPGRRLHDDLVGYQNRFGHVSAEVKRFLDQAGPLWQRGALADKAATGFTGAHTAHGGHETTLASLDNVLTHWGCIIVPPGYTDPAVFQPGNPYGSSCSFQEGSGPDEATLTVARQSGDPAITATAVVAVAG